MNQTPPTLRLYQITDTLTGKAVPGYFSNSKEKARDERKRRNTALGPDVLQYVVSPGPDHRHYRPQP